MQQKNDEQQKENQKKDIQSKQNRTLLRLKLALKRHCKFIGELMTLWGKLSAFFAVLFYLLAWVFLSKIGAQDLYLQSSSSANMLAVAVVVAVALALITIAIMYPSLSVFLLTILPYKENKIPLELLYAYIVAPVVFLVFFIPSLLYFGDSYWTILMMALSLIVIYCIVSRSRIGTGIRNSLIPVSQDKSGSEILNQKVDMSGIYLGLAISAFLALFALLFLNELWAYKIDNIQSFIVFFLCILLGYVPGGVYIALRYKQVQVQNVVKIMIGIVIVTVLVGFVFVPIKIRTTLFKLIGVYQEEPQMFLLLNPNKELKEEIGKSFFINNKKLDKEIIDNQLSIFQENNIFTAHTMYYLGNVRLICKNHFNPDQIQDKNDLLNSCFVFKPDEVRRLYRKIDSQGSKVKD